MISDGSKGHQVSRARLKSASNGNAFQRCGNNIVWASHKNKSEVEGVTFNVGWSEEINKVDDASLKQSQKLFDAHVFV